MTQRRMLILDDDSAVGQTIQWLAESLGFRSEYVTAPDAFFRCLEQAKYDHQYPNIIVIDLAMPGLDGVEVMRLLAERACSAKIVISSGMGTRVLDAAKRSAVEHGLNILGTVSKPISRDALRAVVGSGEEEEPQASAKEELHPQDGPQISAAELSNAIDNDEIESVFQPKVECRSGHLDGFEALARWKSFKYGLLLPDLFIPVAEANGLIDALTEVVFRKSLEWLVQNYLQAPVKLSLNFSAKSLIDIRTVDRLYETCRSHAIDPERVILEMTETCAMADSTLTLDMLTRFRVKGFHLSIDDFGTGYSSMMQLARLPFSELKVDKSFVMQKQQTHESRTIIKSIVDLGHSLGLCVTAEGVENRATLDYLNAIGCDLAQGYFIACPMPGDKASLWLTKHSAVNFS
jgi:EAL domain-containing protein (putative c-di-GMP-specific phosphodiesterase class I)/CheY-like chemotaxis protein